MEPGTEPTTVPADTATERTRVREILALVRGAQLEPSFAEPLIREGRSLDQVRHAVLEAMIARGLPDAGPRPGPAGVSRVTGTDDFRQAAADALCLRASIPVRSPHPAARDLLGTSVVELAKISLSRVGQRIPGGGPTAILTRAGAHTPYSPKERFFAPHARGSPRPTAVTTGAHAPLASALQSPLARSQGPDRPCQDQGMTFSWNS